MVDPYVGHSCHFIWQISNPYVPRQQLETKFYHGSPSARLWEVTFLPEKRSMMEWDLLFSLKYVQYDESDRFLADQIRVDISLNGRILGIVGETNYTFNARNDHTYRFNTFVGSPSTEFWYVLKIEIRMEFRAQPIEELRPRLELYSTEEDFDHLAESMTRLFHESTFSDMLLQSTSGILRAHICILKARWKRLLDEENILVPPMDAVQTNISHTVLTRILLYMYSGEFHFLNPAFTTELFQVIDRYNIYHLYKVFIPSDAEQRRLTVRNVTRFASNFVLDNDVFQRINDPSHTWEVGESDPFRVRFQIKFLMNEDTPKFSFSLRLETGPRCYVLVTLYFIKKVKYRDVINPRKRYFKVHQHEYTIQPGGETLSGICDFEGGSLQMEDIRGPRRIGRRQVSYLIHCDLRLSDGTESAVIETSGIDLLEANQVRFDDLSDHLYLLRKDPTHADVHVSCDGGDTDFLHLAILDARVPQWRQVVNIHGAGPQALADTDVTGPAFGYILDYMYSGKTLAIPRELLDEIGLFAVEGGFVRLQSLIEELRQA